MPNVSGLVNTEYFQRSCAASSPIRQLYAFILYHGNPAADPINRFTRWFFGKHLLQFITNVDRHKLNMPVPRLGHVLLSTDGCWYSLLRASRRTQHFLRASIARQVKSLQVLYVAEESCYLGLPLQRRSALALPARCHPEPAGARLSIPENNRSCVLARCQCFTFFCLKMVYPAYTYLHIPACAAGFF